MPNDHQDNASHLVILTAPGTRPSKRFYRNEDGSTDVHAYQLPKHFTASCKHISNLEGLYALIEELTQTNDSFLIRGCLREDLDHTRKVRRRLPIATESDPNECAIEDQPCSWLMIDVDKVALPAGMDVTKTPGEAVRYAVSMLPSEFHHASYIWQLSASCGLYDKNSISAHLFFWLTEPWLNENLRAWGKQVNSTSGQKPIDTAVFNAVQPHYVASPTFENIDDPIKGPRLGFHRAEKHAVDLKFEPPERFVNDNASEFSGVSIEGVGYEAKMAPLGDGPGELGFNRVLVSAVAAYVSQAGRERAEATREYLKADIRERIDEADKTRHSVNEIARYKSDAYLDDIINSAIEKYGNKEQIPPHWETLPITLGQGEARLKTAIDAFGKAAKESLDDPSAETPVLAIKATAGLGKTQSVIKQLLAYNLLKEGDVHYFVPTHQLSRQMLEDLNAELSRDLPKNNVRIDRARIIGGRGQLGESELPLCRKYVLANKIAAAGGNVFPLLCRNRSGQCEYFENCEYLAQMDDPSVQEIEHNDLLKLLTEVKVMTHEHLFLRTKEQFLPPSLVVIDESFVRSAYTKKEVPVIDVIKFGGPDSIIGKIGLLLLSQEPNLLTQIRAICTSKQLLDELYALDSDEVNPFSDLQIDASLDKQLASLSSVEVNRTPLVIRALAQEMQLTDRDISHAVVSDGDTVSVYGRKALELPSVPILMIDADADPVLLEPFFERKIPVENIAVERQAEIHQFKDRTFSKRSLADESLLTEVCDFIKGVASTGKTLVVASKGIRTAIAGEADTYEGATMQHFNNLRGVNTYSEYQNVIVIGREQPSSTGLEEVARGIWRDSPESLKLLKDRSGSKPMIKERRGYRLREGRASVDTLVHPDWRVQALLEQIREAESTQAIDRLRLLRAHPEGLQRRVFILSSVPLDITVDHLWSWDSMQESLRIVEACNGVIPLNPVHLIAAMPSLGSERTAKRKITELKRATSLISIFISNLSLLTAKYITGGQKKPSKVLYDSELEVAQVEDRLSELAGEPVTLKE